ncbi:MAG: ATP-binding cassette domain-containing protein [Anaerolineae bacterium]|nr:ATP-binding cassette domain-containing protein [Anaerolineae bacterium]
MSVEIACAARRVVPEPDAGRASKPFLSVEGGLLWPGAGPIDWRMRDDEQWAVVGPNGSGKTALLRAIAGRRPLAGGRIVYHFASNGGGAGEVALVEFGLERRLMGLDEPYYGSRWNSPGGTQVPLVSQFLSPEAALGLNPFRLPGNGRPAADRAAWEARQAEVARLLGIEPLLDRTLVQLSSGERRKVLLARALLRRPRLLLLDDPFAGLDDAFRPRLAEIIAGLAGHGLRLVIAAPGWDYVPGGTTHVLDLSPDLLTLPTPDHRDGASATPSCVGCRGTGAIRPACAWAAHRPASRRPDTCAPWRCPGQVCAQCRCAPASGGAGGTGVGSSPCRGGEQTPPSRVGKGAGGSGEILVHVQSATVRYGGVDVLRGVDWTVRAGERWALLGPNGAGKTTLLGLIMGDNPQAYANRISLFGRRRGTGESIWEIKARIGWVAPELESYVPPRSTCLDVACSGFFDSVGLHRPPTPGQRAAAGDVLERLGLLPLAAAPFGSLSGGQKRAVLVARALVKGPALLVLDEPCQGLDAAHRERILALLDDAPAPGDEAALIYVTHDPLALPRRMTHLLRLEAGRVAARECLCQAGGERERN